MDIERAATFIIYQVKMRRNHVQFVGKWLLVSLVILNLFNTINATCLFEDKLYPVSNTIDFSKWVDQEALIFCHYEKCYISFYDDSKSVIFYVHHAL